MRGEQEINGIMVLLMVSFGGEGQAPAEEIMAFSGDPTG